MCGISGIVNLSNNTVAKPDIINMMSAMKHRGPDDEGLFTKDSVGLGFVRLSIIDLTKAGHQPMKSDDDRYVMVFNGEIFNYIEIRDELKANGIVFNTNTDSEVLLKSYIFWGEACLHKLNGMWAFAIYDKLEKVLFASRDRFGVKPFYYYKDNERLVFASEIPSILTVLKQKPTANQGAIFDFIVFNRTDQNEETFFNGIFRLKHGCTLEIKDKQVKINQWYNLKENLKKPFKDADEYGKMFSESIRLRLRSDVPVGICFSGGLDSSSILSVIYKNLGKTDINTFSAVYAKNEYGDESEYINLYRDEVKNMHFISPSASTLFKDLTDFTKSHAEPIPSTSPYAQFKVMELAKATVKVTLDGQGADEQLGGYHYFFGIYFKELLLKGRWGKLVSEIIFYKKKHKSNYAIKTFIFFLLPSIYKTSLRAQKNGYINRNFFKKHKRNSKTSDTIYNSTSLNQALLDHFEYKLEHLLKWEDRNSMHFSIEARVPFLDYRLVERTLSLPADKIIHEGTTKFILREAMNGLIPEKIYRRQDKLGFGTPEAEWFRNEIFKPYVLELLNSKSFTDRKIIDPKKALTLYHQHLERKINISQEIWKWINLELWFRHFID
jgi:asparagine synthase (glutamine-hydrolysing)